MSKTVMENDRNYNANITCNLASLYVKMVIESGWNHVFDTWNYVYITAYVVTYTIIVITIILYVGSIPYYGLFLYIEFVVVTSVARFLRTCKQCNRYSLLYVYGISKYRISFAWLKWFICNQHATLYEHTSIWPIKSQTLFQSILF